MEGEYPFALFASAFCFLCGIVDCRLRYASEVFFIVYDYFEGVGGFEKVLLNLM